MSVDKSYTVAVIGGGIVGLATAWALTRQGPVSLIVLEAEDRVGAHQTGHNSGVIHSGLYYRPGSLKASNCTAGRERMYRFCLENGIPHRRCGKLVVATNAEEVSRLHDLEGRGLANGLTGLERLAPSEIRSHEPHVRGLEGLRVPQAGIVDFGRVAETLARRLRDGGAEIRTGARVTRVVGGSGGFVLESTTGVTSARNLINCAGLQSDRIARMCGVEPEVRIVPFRGEYYKLAPESEHLVRHLVYPVPDPRFPFLGVHFTRMIRGGVEAGPNAVLALHREGYRRTSFSLSDTADIVGYGGFWRMARKNWRAGIGETYRSFSKRGFVAALQRLVPDIRARDLRAGGAGVRAQAVSRDGSLVDDFRIQEAGRMIHVLNAPSPAATASLSIGESLARRARRALELN